jgi:hypothetical protein
VTKITSKRANARDQFGGGVHVFRLADDLHIILMRGEQCS